MKTILQKFLVLLLLISFANIVTARPGCHLRTVDTTADAEDLKFNKTESFTLIEFILERVHGLSDNIPNNEETGVHYSVFRTHGKITSTPRIKSAEQPKNVIYLVSVPAIDLKHYTFRYSSPITGILHSFLFRLTPF
ncbi:MAG: hypothetical protein IBJ16_04440 [Chitinophagaceae bacterium]|nr:hypothetical protein [Chitinophagaceae bacterium]